MLLPHETESPAHAIAAGTLTKVLRGLGVTAPTSVIEDWTDRIDLMSLALLTLSLMPLRDAILRSGWDNTHPASEETAEAAATEPLSI
jgi:hypothetical protein